MKARKLCLVAILLTSCTGTQIPIKTLDDVAHEACEVFFSKERKISIEDAANAFCSTEEQLRPFLQGLKAAGRKADFRERVMGR